MKKVFQEKATIGTWEQVSVWSDWDATIHVERRTVTVLATTSACYDQATRVLVVDVACTDDQVAENRWLETVDTRAEAIRRAIHHADWYAGVIRAVLADRAADARPDADIIAAAKAADTVRYPSEF